MTTVEAHSCLLNMHVTFDLAEIEELMPQQARKQLEAELEKSCCSLGGICCLYTAILVSPVQSSPESRFYRDPCLNARNHNHNYFQIQERYFTVGSHGSDMVISHTVELAPYT